MPPLDHRVKGQAQRKMRELVRSVRWHKIDAMREDERVT